MQVKKLSLIILIHFSLVNCVYRFSNHLVRPPNDARSICVAPIHNISKIAVPHHILWSAIQKELARDGHLVLTSADQADLYLRAHLKEAQGYQYSIDAPGRKVQEDLFLDEDSQKPNLPWSYQDLSKSDRYAKRQSLSFVVDVEVWDLRKKQKVLNASYPLNGNFNMFGHRATLEGQFIRHQENMEYLFTSLANRAAQRIVSALL